MRRRRLLWAAGTVVLAAVAWFTLSHRTPTGQPPLFEISEASFGELRAAFNRTSAESRLVLLLSPT